MPRTLYRVTNAAFANAVMLYSDCLLSTHHKGNAPVCRQQNVWCYVGSLCAHLYTLPNTLVRKLVYSVEEGCDCDTASASTKQPLTGHMSVELL
jgi:hypothetical protein